MCKRDTFISYWQIDWRKIVLNVEDYFLSFLYSAEYDKNKIVLEENYWKKLIFSNESVIIKQVAVFLKHQLKLLNPDYQSLKIKWRIIAPGININIKNVVSDCQWCIASVVKVIVMLPGTREGAEDGGFRRSQWWITQWRVWLAFYLLTGLWGMSGDWWAAVIWHGVVYLDGEYLAGVQSGAGRWTTKAVIWTWTSAGTPSLMWS